jgi:diguanylate cyclase (GGDEF)-like protein
VPYEDDDSERTHVSYSSELAEELRKRQGAKDRPYLVVLSGADVGQMHKVGDGESVIGRSSTANVRLTDEGVSRRHAKLIVQGKVVLIEDLGSANGMFVNGLKIVGQTPLKDGDQIQLGGTTILKFTYHDSLEEEFQRKMYEAALRDPLTKSFNKKYFLDRLAIELTYAKRHQSPLALIMFDVDFFKRVNDTWGHLAGDAVLIKIAGIAQGNMRNEDMFARYGGEEFVVMARATPTEEASILAERLREQVQTTQFAFEANIIPVTISLGVAAFPQVAAGSPTDLIAAADEALYSAKHAGRNRSIVYQVPR